MEELACKFAFWAARSSWWKSFIVWYIACLLMNAFIIYLISKSDDFMLRFKPMALGATILVLVFHFLWLSIVRKMVRQEERKT